MSKSCCCGREFISFHLFNSFRLSPYENNKAAQLRVKLPVLIEEVALGKNHCRLLENKNLKLLNEAHVAVHSQLRLH